VAVVLDLLRRPRDYLRAVEYADPNLRAQASAERQRDPIKFMNPS
jgi:hypothetical protein